MDTVMNVYAISRSRDLREFGRLSHFDAPFYDIRRPLYCEQTVFSILVSAYLCTAKNATSFVRIGDGFFFANHAGQVEFGNARVMEKGLIYATPHQFDTRFHLIKMPIGKFRENMNMPETWHETWMENPCFYGDHVNISGILEDRMWNLREAHKLHSQKR